MAKTKREVIINTIKKNKQLFLNHLAIAFLPGAIIGSLLLLFVDGTNMWLAFFLALYFCSGLSTILGMFFLIVLGWPLGSFLPIIAPIFLIIFVMLIRLYILYGFASLGIKNKQYKKYYLLHVLDVLIGIWFWVYAF